MWQGTLAVLAFTIRYREIPTGRAAVEPRLSVPENLATTGAFRISDLPSMAKVNVEIDNHFTPSPREEGSLFTLIIGVGALALGAGVMALLRSLGVI